MLYEAGAPMTLSILVQECARSQYLLRLAFDMPYKEYPTETDISDVNENNPMLWNLVADLLSSQVIYAGRQIKVLQTGPELLLQLTEGPMIPNEDLKQLTPTTK